MSLCFRAAFRAKQSQSITEQEYLRHMIAHFRGVRHPEDGGTDVIVSKFDPVGASFRVMALRSDYEPLLVLGHEDTALYEELFNSCLTGNLSLVTSNLTRIEENQSLRVPLQPLATLAAFKGQGEILQLCLDNGVTFDKHLDRAAQLGASTSMMLNILFAANWRNIQHSQKSLDQVATHSIIGNNVETLSWALDHGARVDSAGVTLEALTLASIPTMAVIVERCGILAFKSSGALQRAARLGKQDVLKFLLDAGIDIEGIPAIWDIRESGPYTALYEAVRENQVETVKLLLNYGAIADTPSGSPLETPLQAAKRKNFSEIANMLEVSARL